MADEVTVEEQVDEMLDEQEHLNDSSIDEESNNEEVVEEDSEADDESNDESEEEAIYDNEEPVVRKRMTPKDHIIARQQKKIEKMKNQKSDDDNDDLFDDDDADEEENLNEDKINELVSERLKPIYEEKAQAEDEKEISDFITENPEFEKYAGKVREFAKHPSRAQIPIKSLFYEVAGDNLMKIGAQRAQKAEDEASRGNAGGGSTRNNSESGGIDYLDMSSEDFEKKKLEVRQRRR